MIRFILIGLAMLATIPLSDYLVDKSFKQAHESKGYTRQDRAEMERLVRSAAKPHKTKRADRGVMVKIAVPATSAEWADTVADVWNVEEYKR